MSTTDEGLTPRKFLNAKIDWSAIAFAVLLTFGAYGLRLILSTFLDRATFMPFFLAVIFSAWRGGIVPGVLATILSTILSATMSIPARPIPPSSSPVEYVQLILFLISAMTVSYVAGSLREAELRLEKEKNRLTEEMGRRELAEEMVREGENRLHLALDAGRMGVWEWNLKSKKVTWTTSLEALFGLQPGTFNGTFEHYLSLIHPSDRERVQGGIDRILESGAVVLERRFRTIHPDGSVHWIASRGRPKYDENGEVIGLHGICWEVTNEVLAEEDSARLAVIVKSSDDGIVSKDLNGNILSWNEGAKRIFGYEPEEIIGKNIDMLLPLDRKYEEQIILSKLRNGESVEHFETIRLRKDGQPIVVAATISPIRDSQGVVIGASKIVRDITERKNTEAALLEADRKKDEFLATLAHELRNPLAPIQSGLDVLTISTDAGSSASQILPVMQRNLNQMVRLVDDLLDVSRITSGKLNLRLGWVSVRDLLNSVSEMTHPMMESRRQTLNMHLPDDSWHLYGDRDRLAQILSNILNNSSKFSENGQSIELTVDREGETLRFVIEDHGAGIPPEKIDHVFEKFSQVEATREKSQGGLGIGLSLVKALVEMHGGRIEAFSAGIGQGTRITIHLPTNEHLQHDHEPQELAPSESDGRGRRVLLVDDSPDILTMIGRMIEILGHQPYTANDGEIAIKLGDEVIPEVVILDIGMPRMNGYELERLIRERDWGRKAKIVALTGWGTATEKQRILEAGFDQHLLKPIQMSDLQAAISPPAPAEA